jgi:succinate-semialdehyde dehydrogenase/glutarate-semialdehyde dehydrogenase
MNAPYDVRGNPQLQVPELFRQQCYIDGGWHDADDGKTLSVTNPATGQPLGVAGLAREDREGALRHSAQMA